MTHEASTDQPSTEPVSEYFLRLQDQITATVQGFDGRDCREDVWQRPEGGGGRSRVFSGGDVFEQAGVNYSHVSGGELPASATASRPELAGRSFEAMGVSIVMHPRNP